VKVVVGGDESAIGVEDPWLLPTGVLVHSRVLGTAHGPEAGAVGGREAGDDPS
jgi:hypothetical protein